jgi:hypothetical protein
MTDDISDPYDPGLKTQFYVEALQKLWLVERSPCPPAKSNRPDQIFGQRYDIKREDGSTVAFFTVSIDKITWDSLDPRYREKTVLIFYEQRMRELAEVIVKEGRNSFRWVERDSWEALRDLENKLKAKDLEL